MIQETLEAIKAALGNQFVTGGLVLGIVGTVIATARSLPGRLWKYIVSKVIVGVYVHNDDYPFEWLAVWLDHHPYTSRARTLTAMSEYNDEGDRMLIFTPAPGNHLLWVGGRPIWLHREREKAEQKTGFGATKARESFYIGALGRSQAPIRRLIEDAKKLHDVRKADTAHVYVASYGDWSRVGTISRRGLDSVILPDGMRDSVVNDLQSFRDSEDWYFEMGIPYHRGYLLHGTPGSGKSSLVTAIAAKFNCNMYLVNLANKLLNDDALVRLINAMEERSILLFEDVDAAVNVHERSGTKGKKKDDEAAQGVSLSGLLNCLDGLLARDGTVVFMTTNHRQLLDPALIRPGRCDMQVEFKLATREQAEQMFKRFFPEVDRIIAACFGDHIACAKVSMAVVQETLYTNRNDYRAAMEAARKLYHA